MMRVRSFDDCNLASRLRNREIGVASFPTRTQRTLPNRITEAKRMYQNIVPNHTVADVRAPNVFIKQFTANGSVSN